MQRSPEHAIANIKSKNENNLNNISSMRLAIDYPVDRKSSIFKRKALSETCAWYSGIISDISG